MTRLLIKNIGCLAQVEHNIRTSVRGAEMQNIDTINNAYLLIEDEKIIEFGQMELCPERADKVIDANGGYVLPTFCDSHTHIVYAGSREHEFIDKINGLSYEEIAQRGGGILNSALRLHKTSEEELFEQALERLEEMKNFGTGAVEIKSGYGLSTEDELKMLRVIRKLKEKSDMTIKSTFLGAHAVPTKYKGRQSDYVDLICTEMIPLVAQEGLADFIDVFCDKGFFTVEETAKMLETGAKYGMRPKIHANELDVSGGVQVGVKYDALSVDHLERATDVEIEVLKHSNTIPTGLPGTSFFLNLPYTPAKKMIQAGLPLALASDYNPGSTPSGNMKFVLSLACIKMRLTPNEAINATTINTAAAMGISKTHGSIAIGKQANLYITKPISSIDFIPYAYNTPIVKQVILNGKIQ
ncbi:MAG: imidazolonepropionase [Bacteroidales bacterium]|nr:imidazolonepropionase [Bacteroidales bacterium]